MDQNTSMVFDLTEKTVQEWISYYSDKNATSKDVFESDVQHQQSLKLTNLKTGYDVSIACIHLSNVHELVNTIELRKKYCSLLPTEFTLMINALTTAINFVYQATIAARDFIIDDDDYIILQKTKFKLDQLTLTYIAYIPDEKHNDNDDELAINNEIRIAIMYKEISETEIEKMTGVAHIISNDAEFINPDNFTTTRIYDESFDELNE